MIEILGNFNGYMTENYLRLILVVVIAIVGFFIIKITNKYVDRIFRRVGFDKTLKVFARRTVDVFLWVILIIIILDNLGFNVIGFVAGLSILGFIVGFATKDVLSNLAAGMFLLVARPYKVSEEVIVSGIKGEVQEITMSATIVTTAEKEYVMIPNSKAWGGPIKNLSRLKEKK